MPLIELLVVMAITAAAALWSTTSLVQTADDLVATSTGTYIDSVAAGAQRHMLAEFNNLAAAADVPGTANDLQPTLAELQALGRLPDTFPGFSPGNQLVRVFITRTGCPGPGCNLVAAHPGQEGGTPPKSVELDCTQTAHNQGHRWHRTKEQSGSP